MSRNNDPLVSIIVITYNSSKYVLETLESAKAQTYQNIELIVSDDASQDDTVEICKAWLEENTERFVRTELVTTEKNSGIPANCNRGVKAAEGEWVKLIAGDDTLIKDCLAKKVDFVNSNQSILVLFSSMNKYREEIKLSNLINKSTGLEINNITKKLFFELSANKQYEILLIENRVKNSPTFFARKDVFVKVNYYDEQFKHIEDYPMWLKLTKAGIKLSYLEYVTVNYRLHDSSIFGSQRTTLVNKQVFLNRDLRKSYVYPFISRMYKYNYYYKITLSLLLKHLFNNKSTRISRFISYHSRKTLNPIKFIIQILNIKILK